MNIILFLLVLPGYFTGSIPFGYIIAKFVAKEDIRKQGSGNIGGTNVSRILGFKWGLLTVLLDALKAIVPLLVLKNILLTDSIPDRYVICAVGISIIIGHVFPVFLNFRGGKGVATFVGVIVALLPLETLVFLLCFVVLLSVTRYMSIASMVSVSIFPVIIIIFNGFNPGSLPYIVFSIFLMVMIIARHKANIIRLMNHEEPKFTFKKKSANKK